MSETEEERLTPVGQRLLRGAVEAVHRFEYLFLIPYGCFGDWQVATRDGKVITTLDPKGHFGGRMPKIIADKHFLATVPHEDLMAGVPTSLDD